MAADTGRTHFAAAALNAPHTQLVQQHAATFFDQAEAAAGADLPQFMKDEFDATRLLPVVWCQAGEQLVEAPESCPC